jgi:hypothetical protein
MKGLGVVPENEWDQFMAALRADLPTTFRITSNSMFGKEIRKRLEEQFLHKTGIKGEDDITVEPPKPIPWFPNNNAWSFDVPRKLLRRNPELDAFHKFIVAQSDCVRIVSILSYNY